MACSIVTSEDMLRVVAFCLYLTARLYAQPVPLCGMLLLAVVVVGVLPCDGSLVLLLHGRRGICVYLLCVCGYSCVGMGGEWGRGDGLACLSAPLPACHYLLPTSPPSTFPTPVPFPLPSLSFSPPSLSYFSLSSLSYHLPQPYHHLPACLCLLLLHALTYAYYLYHHTSLLNFLLPSTFTYLPVSSPSHFYKLPSCSFSSATTSLLFLLPATMHTPLLPGSSPCHHACTVPPCLFHLTCMSL